MVLWQLLFGSAAHFIIVVFGAFTFLAAGILYLNASHVDKHNNTVLFRSVGFFFLAINLVIHASTVLPDSVLALAQAIKIVGLFLILISLLSEPILHAPFRKKTKELVGVAGLTTVTWVMMPLSITLFLLIAITYLRKATEGMEKQLKGAGIAFLFFAAADAFQIPLLWSDTPVIFWSKVLSEFGIVWGIQHILQLAGSLIFAIWIWGYIRFQVRMQLLVSTIALSLIIFVTTTVFYTFLLLRNMEEDAFSHLATDVKVLDYSLGALKAKTLTNAQAIAQDSSITAAFDAHDSEKLYARASDYMLAQQTDTLVIASASGQVAMRAEDRERTNDNVSTDPIVSQALSGTAEASVSYGEDILAPRVVVTAAAPIRNNGSVTGVVLTGFAIDSAFVDGVKSVTGLDTTVFGNDTRAATTFVAPDGKSRFVGTLETNQKIVQTVLHEGKPYVGSAQVLNQPYYTAYAPLNTFDGKTIGMLFAGKRQDTLIGTAKRSIDLTFLGSIILMVITLIPAYFFSRFLQKQAEA